MKSKLLTGSLLATAALAVAAFASPAAAAKINYTFGTPSGGAYCDGIQMSASNGGYAGFHINSNCDSVNDPAGGFKAKISKTSVVEGITGVMDALPNTPIVFYLNTKAGSWTLYLNSFNLDGTSAWDELNAGVLINGAPAAKKGGVSSIHAKPGVKIDKAF